MDHPAPIAATVLTGFLGSGKTTLLNRLLKAPAAPRIALVVNEFGAVGVDGALVAGGEQFVELDNGCLCCALNEDLDKTLRMLLTRGGFDHVVVETTGLADPLPVAWAFTRPGLSAAYRVDAIVAVVDAVNIFRALDAASEAQLQVQRADIVVLSKTDIAADGGVAARARVRQLNAIAPVVEAPHGEVPWELLMGQARVVTGHQDASRSPSHPHGAHAHHAPTFETWAFTSDAVVAERRLEDFLFGLPDDIYRIKGFVRTDAEWTWTLVNMVAGRVDMRPCAPTRDTYRAGLVFIGPRLDRDWLAAQCADLFAPS